MNDFTLPTIGNDILDRDLAVIFPDQEINGRFQNGVDQLSLGLSLNLGKKLDLEGDLILRFWSKMKSWQISGINSLTMMGMNGTQDTSLEAEWNWVNTVSLRLGAEYHVSKPLDIRLGLLYDPSPISTEYLTAMVPDSSKFGISAGLGYKFKYFSIDFAYLMIFAGERLECSNNWYIPDMKLRATTGSVLFVSIGINF